MSFFFLVRRARRAPVVITPVAKTSRATRRASAAIRARDSSAPTAVADATVAGIPVADGPIEVLVVAGARGSNAAALEAPGTTGAITAAIPDHHAVLS